MTPVTENELKAHQEKIGGKCVTLDALKANIAKLDAFMDGSAHWDTLSEVDKELMSRQRTFMAHYYDVLMARISRFD